MRDGQIFLRAGVAAALFLLLLANAAFAAAGSLDASFDGDGRVITPIGVYDDEARGVAIQSDGKVVAAGFSWSGIGDDFAVARYLPSGALDTSFGGDGTVTTPLSGFDALGEAVALQADGKILVGGFSWNGTDYDFALARYLSNGALDSSFDGDGKAESAIGGSHDEIYALALQPDGRIVAGGIAWNGADTDFALARYLPDGSLDPSFDGDGKLILPIGQSNDHVFALAVQPDGKIVAAGPSHNGTDWDFALARFAPNGTPDPTFSGDGKVTAPIGAGGDRAYALAMQGDGKLVVAGESSVGSVGNFALARFTQGGSLDPTLDGDGRAVTPIGAQTAGARALVIQPDGRIVAAGRSNSGNGLDFALARYMPDGSLDGSFGVGGVLTADLGGSKDFAFAVALQSDGNIVAAGRGRGASSLDFALARFLGAGGAPPPPPPGSCTITGTGAGETLSGTPGPDVVCGRGGNDLLKGLGGDDELLGGLGNDTLVGGTGNDQLDGGPGTDTADFRDATGGVTVDLGTGTATGIGSDAMVFDAAGATVESVRGSPVSDSISGDGRKNLLAGSGGPDLIVGGDGTADGPDVLRGGGGADSLDGTDGVGGNDTVDGGTNPTGAADSCLADTGDSMKNCP